MIFFPRFCLFLPRSARLAFICLITKTSGRMFQCQGQLRGAGDFFAHPPLMQMIFVADNFIFGGDNMRVVPFLFSIASAVLLYFVVRNRIDKRAAAWSVGLFLFLFTIFSARFLRMWTERYCLFLSFGSVRLRQINVGRGFFGEMEWIFIANYFSSCRLSY